LTKRKVKVGLVALVLAVVLLGWYIMAYGAPDFYRPYYVIEKTSEGPAGGFSVGPGEERILATITGKGEVKYVKWIISGAGADEAIYFVLKVDGELIYLLFRPVAGLRLYYSANTPGVQVLRDDTTNNYFSVACTIQFSFKEKLEVGVYNAGTTSYNGQIYIIYTLYEELREPP